MLNVFLNYTLSDDDDDDYAETICSDNTLARSSDNPFVILPSIMAAKAKKKEPQPDITKSAPGTSLSLLLYQRVI
jgi:hypothetical protein